VHYDEAWASLGEVDVLLCSTASQRPVVNVANVHNAITRRGDRPLCILDIAVPRDVETEVGQLDNVYLYDLDDLQAVVSASLARRQSELPAAERLIAEEVESYWQWVAGLAAVPVLTQLRSEVNRVRERELEAALRRLEDLTPEQRAIVTQFAQSLTNKFLHEPSIRLRAAAANGRGLGVVDAARYLFGLDERDGESAEHDAEKDHSPRTPDSTT
jgi:Glutamyl-tRNA reductase